MSGSISGGSGSALDSLTTSATKQLLPVVGSLVSLSLAELTQHTARLKGATSENTAADEVIPQFDLDMRAINAAWTNGQASLTTCQQALQAVVANCKKALQALVGKPGTAWSGSELQAAQGAVPCNKTCTVSCCLYYNDIYPAIYGAKQFANGQAGALQALAGNGQVSGTNKYTSYVPEVYPPDNSAYGNFTRPSYTLDWTPPPVPFNALENVQASVAQLSSLSNPPAAPVAVSALATVTTPPPTAKQPASAIGAAPSSKTKEYVIVGAVALVLLGLLFAAIEG